MTLKQEVRREEAECRAEYAKLWGQAPPDGQTYAAYVTWPGPDQVADLQKRFALPEATGLRSFLKNHRRHLLLFCALGVACPGCDKTWRRPWRQT